MDLHAVVGQVKGHVGGVKEVIRKELLDHILLIAQTDDKLIISELGVIFHDVPEDRFFPDLDHWLWF